VKYLYTKFLIVKDIKQSHENLFNPFNL